MVTHILDLQDEITWVLGTLKPKKKSDTTQYVIYEYELKKDKLVIGIERMSLLTYDSPFELQTGGDDIIRNVIIFRCIKRNNGNVLLELFNAKKGKLSVTMSTKKIIVTTDFLKEIKNLKDYNDFYNYILSNSLISDENDIIASLYHIFSFDEKHKNLISEFNALWS